jgi:hypothetical protein
MTSRTILLTILTAILLEACACSRVPPVQNAQSAGQSGVKELPGDPPDQSLAVLFSHIWQITQAHSQPPAGSIYIFLPNGTLLETSCVETYRIGRWTADKTSPRDFHVVEDRQRAFNARITELTNSTLRLQQQLVRSKETRDLTLTAVEEEFVCPDMPK